MSRGAFRGKKIILGISGGIAAYKAAILIRELITSGAEVKVVTTPSALHFVTELTLSTLSRNKVLTDTFDSANEGTWHISHTMWADLIILAPATINTVAKIAHGFADNALTTLVSARRSPVLLCPTADEDMYRNPFHRKNLTSLAENDFYVLEAEYGSLASSLEGQGRLPSTEKILDAAEMLLDGHSRDLKGKNILVTAGPTHEAIDPVRFIGNRSSGKMGYAIAKMAYLRGANVTLISGPSSLSAYPEISVIKITSAAEMNLAVKDELHEKDAIIMAAAVADFAPQSVSELKIKKKTSDFALNLVPAPDVLMGIRNEPLIKIGFALETNSGAAFASEKLSGKNLDAIVLNQLTDEGAGFETDTNKITIMFKNGDSKAYPVMSKRAAAHNILDALRGMFRV